MKHQGFDFQQTCYVLFHTQEPKVTMQSSNPKKTELFGRRIRLHTFQKMCGALEEKPPVGWFLLLSCPVENPAKAQVPQELLLLKLLSLLWPYLMARFGRSSGSITEGFCAGESFLLT